MDNFLTIINLIERDTKVMSVMTEYILVWHTTYTCLVVCVCLYTTKCFYLKKQHRFKTDRKNCISFEVEIISIIIKAILVLSNLIGLQ